MKVPVVELVYRNNTKPSKRYKIVTAKDVHELLVSPFTYSGAYPFTFRQPIKHKIAFKSTILYPFIP